MAVAAPQIGRSINTFSWMIPDTAEDIPNKSLSDPHFRQSIVINPVILTHSPDADIAEEFDAIIPG